MITLPADDGIKVFGTGRKVTVSRVLRTGDDGFGNGGNGGEVHICYPHGDYIEARFRSGDGKTGCAGGIHGDGIHIVAIHQGSEIVFHNAFSCLYVILFYYMK